MMSDYSRTAVLVVIFNIFLFLPKQTMNMIWEYFCLQSQRKMHTDYLVFGLNLVIRWLSSCYQVILTSSLLIIPNTIIVFVEDK